MKKMPFAPLLFAFFLVSLLVLGAGPGSGLAQQSNGAPTSGSQTGNQPEVLKRRLTSRVTYRKIESGIRNQALLEKAAAGSPGPGTRSAPAATRLPGTFSHGLIGFELDPLVSRNSFRHQVTPGGGTVTACSSEAATLKSAARDRGGRQ